jgi:hypothetical protein
MFRGCSTGPRQGQRLEFKRVRQTGNRAGGTSASKAGAHRPLLCAGSGAAVAARRYWRLWWTASASPGPATGRPTGSRWAKRKGEAGWTAITKRMAPLASCCSSIRSAVTSSSGSGRPSRPVSVKPRPRQIGLDKPPEAVNNYNSRGTSVNPRCATVLFCFLSPLPLATAQTSALWTTYQHDSRHSGMAPFVGPQTDSGNLIFDLNGGIHLTQVAPTCCGFRTSWPEQS